jgi:hypothetical protein
MTKEELFERLASIEHERWADWQSYVHSKCVKNDDGTLTIPKWAVEQWERQINTSYSGLTEEEKDKDREQVMRYWHLIDKLFKV